MNIRTILIVPFFTLGFCPSIHGQARIILTQKTLMHEMRETPSPLNGDTIANRKVSLLWPMAPELNTNSDPLDGFESKNKIDKAKLAYTIRFSHDPQMKSGVTTIVTHWPMYNPDDDFEAGEWYWQYGYGKGSEVKWSEMLHFTVNAASWKFCPPPFETLVKNIPMGHPRIWVTKDGWNDFITKSKNKEERQWFIEHANNVLKTPMGNVSDINTSAVKTLQNEQQVKALLTRESRRIIDKEEANCNALVGAYILTKDKEYATQATARIVKMVNWDKDPNVMGDFNDAALLSLSTMAYDTFYDILSASDKAILLDAIKAKAKKMYSQYNNHLENHIADNHVWQMTLRILTMAAFATYGDLSEAALWADYCYNMWVARMPGLNQDGGWHNGDSYFTVNTRTLIEVPMLYTRLSGYNFFSDPWYKRNILYTIYQQPPFSKSGGNGSSHQNMLQPNSVRVGYLDALARINGDTYAANFVRRTLAIKPDYLKKSFLTKSGDLSWFRLQCDKSLPDGHGLTSLPMGYVFPETGVASFITDWNNPNKNAWWSFRSSPYGSTSHALANQNAFNTFYGGKPLFYSSGHHTSFVDKHAVYSHRATRAHNTILVNGMGQRIGTEGYGWIPRWYVSNRIGYVLGDASNAYGPVISPLWIERRQLAGIEFSPETGWDSKSHVKTFRRHIVALGKSGLIFIYDELEADTAVAWSFLLHSVLKPMSMDEGNGCVHVQATNGLGVSDAWIYSPTKVKTDMTDQFFSPAVNWLKADDNGHFKAYPNHWHFTATSPKSIHYHFATIIDTHSIKQTAQQPKGTETGKMTVGNWQIECCLSQDGKSMFHIRNTIDGTEIDFRGEETTIKDNGKTTVLVDKLPKLEI